MLLIQHALRTPDTVDFVPKLVQQNITSAIHASRPSRNVSRNKAPKEEAQPLPQASAAGEGAVQHEEVLEGVDGVQEVLGAGDFGSVQEMLKVLNGVEGIQE